MSNPLELELWAVVNEMAKNDQLSSHPSQIHCFEYVYPNVYSIYELLECVEGPIQQNQIPEYVISI